MENTITPPSAVSRFRLIILILALFLTTGIAQSAILYVNPTAMGNNTGSSWVDAIKSLQAAVARANATISVTEIRVVGGTFTGPELILTRSYIISGSWNKHTDTQDRLINPTILDGEGSHRIMQIQQGCNVSLQQLEFINGYDTDRGAGLYTKGNVIISNCRFTGNKLVETNFADFSNGGAIYNEGGSLSIDNTVFLQNRSWQTAGAIYNTGSLSIKSCEFSLNSSRYKGGAVYSTVTGTVKVHGTRFNGNYLDFATGQFSTNYTKGGAICSENQLEIVGSILDKNKCTSGGAVYASNKLKLINNTFYANEAYLTVAAPGLGGAVEYNYRGAGEVNGYIYNNIFSANLGINGWSLYTAGAASQLGVGLIIQNNSVEGGGFAHSHYNLAPNIANNGFYLPLFFNPEAGNFVLMAPSLCKDIGNADAYLGYDYPAVDFYGQKRIMGCAIDIGANEILQIDLSMIKPDANGILYINPSSTYAGIDMGSSWDKALNSLSLGVMTLNLCPGIMEVRLAGGTYPIDPQVLSRPAVIRGSYDPQTNEQNWIINPTIFEPAGGKKLFEITTTYRVRFEGCWFRNGNSSHEFANGGAIQSSADLQLTYCRFTGNYGVEGGAINNLGKLNAWNCVFSGNNCNTTGGAIRSAGELRLTNCTFVANSSIIPGMEKSISTMPGTQSWFSNNIMWGGGSLQVSNGGTITLNRNIIQSLLGGTVIYANNASVDQMNADPGFVNNNGDFGLLAGSPAINAGDNAAYEAADEEPGNNSLIYDIDQYRKIRNFDKIIDLGAHERQMKQQHIAASDVTVVYGIAGIAPATNTAPLPVSYAPADNTIAELYLDIDGMNKLAARKKGVTTVQVTQAGNAEYDPAKPVNFQLTVDPKPVNITAEDKTKIYGETDPELSFIVAPALVPGDGITGSLSREAGADVGVYDIGQGNLSLSDNYALNFTGAEFTITPKGIAVNAEAKSITYGDPDPPLTYDITPALVTGDAFTGSLTREPGVNAGTYAIQQGSLALSNNYTLQFTGNDFVIDRKNIAVSAVNASKTYGDADPVLPYTITPALINNDVLNGSLSRTAGEQAGVYPILAGSLDHQNYSIAFTGAQFTINQATQQINWAQALVSDCNGATTLALNASSNSGLPVTYQSSNAVVATVNGNQLTFLSPGLATITAIQSGDVNYLPAANVQLDLTSRLPAYLIKKHWDDVLFFDNSSRQYNAWQWYRNDQPVSNATGQYFYESGKLNGDYYATATNAAGIALPTCPVTISPGTTIHPITVVPNPVRTGQQVTAKISFTQAELTGALISLINIQGTEVGLIQNVTPNTTISMPAFAGIYVVKLRLASGATYSTNVLVKP
ncbi:MBG domain-containing protein [Pseudobacter ginsenosidimutans]|uniref:Putative secreted protein (Por secretion system target) n=1 Tax=Pseudobacter ginsenosidimutans TaxID=661488 RepID=A0A4Q7MUP5_9BACT|nr:MBG domain-containing protein [Pseudobacter ginsenosidimutans]QEC40657.1 hypothetical protein FSB84_02700 [Pseudobacter ginsenosidimutans]RZS72622.1 putative secreted protein (Por secretion system target) [Pseudobacter ginsenosidimutans]